VQLVIVAEALQQATPPPSPEAEFAAMTQLLMAGEPLLQYIPPALLAEFPEMVQLRIVDEEEWR